MGNIEVYNELKKAYTDMKGAMERKHGTDKAKAVFSNVCYNNMEDILHALKNTDEKTEMLEKALEDADAEYNEVMKKLREAEEKLVLYETEKTSVASGKEVKKNGKTVE